MTQIEFAPHYDVVIAGARCAGAATAMLLARQGAKVLVVERDQPGTDTMSTHALMRGAVMQLSRWGTLRRITAAGTPAIRKTSFTYGTETIELDIKPSHGVDALYAPRRIVLDNALAQDAIEAGADIRYGVALEAVSYGLGGRVNGAVLRGADGQPRTVTCDLLIGADGRRSSVARLVGAATRRRSQHATATIYAYFEGLPDHGNRWLYDTRFAAGIIPTNGNQSCVFVAMPQDRYASEMRGRLEAGLLASAGQAFPALGAELAVARRVSRTVGFSGQHGYFRQAVGAGWALVGDAGYFKDPLTAHGITDALRDAEILADAALGGRSQDLAGYQMTRDALSRDLFEVTDAITSLGWDLESLKVMHKQLNQAMKSEQDWMSASFVDQRRKAS